MSKPYVSVVFFYPVLSLDGRYRTAPVDILLLKLKLRF